jgi:superfamily II DNA or RNA helicase
MQIIDNQILLFRTRQPEKYAVIPRHKIVGEPQPGVYEIAVKWSLEEVRVLRNLGVKNAPSPIQAAYHWPGKFTPFQHQIQTSSFLTLNSRAYCLNEPGCVDSETEYLSPTGWVKISEYKGGKVAQYNLNGTIEFVEPEAYVKLPCEDMIRFKTKYGIDQLLSPEHRVLAHSSANYEKQAVMSAAYVKHMHDEVQTHYSSGAPKKYVRGAKNTIAFQHTSIPAAFFYPGAAGVALTNERLRVQIAVIADGHFPYPETSARCVVRLKKERKITRLRSLLTTAEIEFSEKLDCSVSGSGFHVFTFYAPLVLKKFDARFWGCSAEQLAIVRDEVIHWDGSDRGEAKGSQFFSVEKESADFVQYAFASAGIIARVTEDAREGRRTCYVVTLRKDSPRFLTLRNRNEATVFAEPSTDGFKYCFQVPSTFLLFRRNGCVFASGNTGKSLSCLWASDYLMSKRLIRRVLIICPLSIMESAWMKDLMHSVIHRKAAIAHSHSMENRRKIIRGNYEYVIVNYDGVSGVAKTVNECGDFDLIILDEANYIKNSTAKRWKAIHSIVKPDTWVWALTGTPAPQSPLDAFGLAKMVTPTTVPRFIGTWRDKTMLRVSQFKWIAKGDAPSTVHNALQPAIRFTKDQCLDLPPVLTLTRVVPMTPQQEKYYKLMKQRALFEAAGETVTAVNAATVINKLLQISAGAVYADEKETIEFDCAPRLTALDDIINDTDRKFIVFAPFRSSIDTISQHLTKTGVTHETIHGQVSATRRGEIFNAFQTKPDPRGLVIQPQSASHGVTLTAADTVIFWGPVTSVETYIQCIARADRIGQQAQNITVHHLQCSEIERKMFAALEQRIEDHNLITKMYVRELENP